MLRGKIAAFALALATLSVAPTAAMADAAVSAPTRMIRIDGKKKLAYRTLGRGRPLILANRFRGNLDQWDPAFLDALAQHFRVITFDYSGIGRSTGTQANSHMQMAEDVRDLARALGIDKAIVLGWSLGGLVAQIVVTEFPNLVSHAVLIATRPPGKQRAPSKKIFFDTATVENLSLQDETVLFFNPKYKDSQDAARRSRERIALRTTDRDIPVTRVQWEKTLETTDFMQDAYDTWAKLQKTTIPLLIIAGEDDVSFPVEDWFATKGQLKTAQFILLPATGHAPQHQYPELSAQYIHVFVDKTR